MPSVEHAVAEISGAENPQNRGFWTSKKKLARWVRFATGRKKDAYITLQSMDGCCLSCRLKKAISVTFAGPVSTTPCKSAPPFCADCARPCGSSGRNGKLDIRVIVAAIRITAIHYVDRRPRFGNHIMCAKQGALTQQMSFINKVAGKLNL